MENKKIFTDFVVLTTGCILLAVSINVFLVPYKISAGGISAIGTMLLYLFGIKMSLTNLIFNIALFIFALIAYGVNTMIPGANYLFLARPEAAPSVLDILPPNFFLRTLIIAAVITAMFGLAYLPWYLKGKKKAK